MTTPYDSGVIQTLADRLYSIARSLEGLYGFLGAIITAVPTWVVVKTLSSPDAALVGALLGAGLGALLGLKFAQPKAFSLRLLAQLALCQVQIEKNTAAVGGTTEQEPPVPAHVEAVAP